MSRHHRSRLRGFGTPREVGRDARARARERSGRTFTMVAGVQLSARLFTGCVEQRGSNADRRAFYRRRLQPPSRNIHSTAHPVTEKLSPEIQNLRTEIYRSCGASDFLFLFFFARRGEARVSRSSMKSHASRLRKSAHLRRRLCHPAGAFRTHAPSNADARDVRR